MGTTKTEMFTAKQNRLAEMLKALAHPARIAIIQHLIKTQGCICGDLVDELGLAQATISQHLKELKTAGLIKGIIDGTSVCYCIDAQVWVQFKSSEYQGDTIGKYGLNFNGKHFLLTTKYTACLAKDKCGEPANVQCCTEGCR